MNSKPYEGKQMNEQNHNEYDTYEVFVKLDTKQALTGDAVATGILIGLVIMRVFGFVSSTFFGWAAFIWLLLELINLVRNSKITCRRISGSQEGHDDEN